MNEERLSGLALLSIHRDIDLNMDDIISRFARKNERRMSLINNLDTDLPEKQKVSELDTAVFIKVATSTLHLGHVTLSKIGLRSCDAAFRSCD